MCAATPPGYRMTTLSQALFSWVPPCLFSIFSIGGLTDSFRRVTGCQVPLLRVSEGARVSTRRRQMNNADDPAGRRASGQARMTQNTPVVILRKVGRVKDLEALSKSTDWLSVSDRCRVVSLTAN